MRQMQTAAAFVDTVARGTPTVGAFTAASAYNSEAARILAAFTILGNILRDLARQWVALEGGDPGSGVITRAQAKKSRQG